MIIQMTLSSYRMKNRVLLDNLEWSRNNILRNVEKKEKDSDLYHKKLLPVREFFYQFSIVNMKYHFTAGNITA